VVDVVGAARGIAVARRAVLGLRADDDARSVRRSRDFQAREVARARDARDEARRQEVGGGERRDVRQHLAELARRRGQQEVLRYGQLELFFFRGLRGRRRWRLVLVLGRLFDVVRGVAVERRGVAGVAVERRGVSRRVLEGRGLVEGVL